MENRETNSGERSEQSSRIQEPQRLPGDSSQKKPVSTDARAEKVDFLKSLLALRRRNQGRL